MTDIKENKLGFLNFLVLVLSIYVLVALLVDTLFKLPTEISRLLYYTDNSICAVFFFDFCIRFYRAENKWKFMRWGWIDLLSSVPAIEFLRAGRAVRLIRLLRIANQRCNLFRMPARLVGPPYTIPSRRA